MNTIGNLFVLPLLLLRAFGSPYFVKMDLSGAVFERGIRGAFWRRRKGWSVDQVRRLVKRAIKDRRVLGVVIQQRNLRAGLATVCSLREALQLLKEAGKKLVIHLEEGGTRDYYLACCADQIVMPEGSMLDLRGLSVELTFLGETLRRAGVEVDIDRAGKYKSAAEMFTRSEISGENKEAIGRLLEVVFERIVNAIANGRGVSAEKAKDLVDGGPYDPEKAKQVGLIDELAYSDELPELLAESEGKQARFVKASRYMRRWRFRFHRFWPRRVVAVLSLRGNILSGHSTQFPRETIGDISVRKVIRVLEESRHVAGVVVHIDSPGGGVVASDFIWRAVRKLAEKKPTVAWMGNVAASGGYFIAVACDQIVAQPETITGSIGVIAGKVSFGPLLQRFGIGQHVFRFGKRSGLFSARTALDDDERQTLRQMLEHSYERFVARVIEGRHLSKEEVELVSQGRVWCGEDAKERGLVDSLGDIQCAVNLVKERARRRKGEKLEVADVRIPMQKGFFPRIMGGAGNTKSDWLAAHLPQPADAFWRLRNEALWSVLPYRIRIR
ncbi:MAG: signal peptide peptidase SppA [Pseudomonadota bacterium]